MIVTNKGTTDLFFETKSKPIIIKPGETVDTRNSNVWIAKGAAAINSIDTFETAPFKASVDKYKFIYHNMGLDSRLNKLKEELGECLVAACHLQDNKVKAGDLIEEMGDVALLIYQIVDILDAEKEFQNCIDYKKVNFCDKFGAVE